MNTGTYYIYEYNGSRRIRNLGFFKITCYSQIYHIRLCIRGITVTRNDLLPLYIFRLNHNSENAYLIEKILCEHHSVSTVLEIPFSQFPASFTLDNIDGFFLLLPDQTILAAHDPKLSFDSFSVEFTPITESGPETQCTEDEPSKDVSSITCTDRTIEKISRTELSRLPRRYWNLANNSFLLHGYHNYNHLLLIEEDGHYILGVPGIKDKYELRVAKMFGFSSFSTEYVTQLSLTDDEKEADENFGHWCCIIPKTVS